MRVKVILPTPQATRRHILVKLVVIDGTPEEVVAVAKGLEMGTVVPAGVAPAAPPSDMDAEDKVFVTIEVARKVLSRRPLSREQMAVLKTLAKRHPDWVPAADLHKVTGYTPAQFAGLMGAFGRRVTHTEGYVPGTWMFDAEWNYDIGAYDYRLPDSVLEAMKAEKLI